MKRIQNIFYPFYLIKSECCFHNNFQAFLSKHCQYFYWLSKYAQFFSQTLWNVHCFISDFMGTFKSENRWLFFRISSFGAIKIGCKTFLFPSMRCRCQTRNIARIIPDLKDRPWKPGSQYLSVFEEPLSMKFDLCIPLQPDPWMSKSLWSFN